MRFGIFDHLDRRDEPLGRFFDDRLAFARATEAAGFHAYHIAEHHGTPLGMAPSPNLFLAALARETRRLRFGPLVYLLPLYHPVRLIEEVCMLDHLSDGRLELGVGRGISPYEVACYGIEANAHHAARARPPQHRLSLRPLSAARPAPGVGVGWVENVTIDPMSTDPVPVIPPTRQAGEAAQPAPAAPQGFPGRFLH